MSLKLLRSVLIGLGIIYIVATVFSLIFSLLLRFTSIQEDSLTYVITAISFIALFIGGFFSGGKGKEKGWLSGGLTGLFYTVINFLFQYLGFDSVFSLEQMIYYLLFILTATIGGMIGVNVAGNHTNQA